MSVHEGHRQRLKQRFADHGERVFDDHQLLELMLFYACLLYTSPGGTGQH